DRLVSLAMPRIKDFRGFKNKSFDGRGNYSFGLTEQGIFPEVDMAHAQHTFGMHITLVFKNSNDELSKIVMTELGFPFVKPPKKKKPAAAA
ncbi:MAG: 50S ribosomal protein L5, partial [Planctomycetota bacterium]